MGLFSIGGIASGIDFNSVVEQLIALERKPVTLLEDKRQVLSWKKDFWSEIQTTLKALDTSVETLLKRSTMMARSSSTSDQAVATATAVSDAALGTYKVNVLGLATSTRVTSGAGASSLGVGGVVDINQPVSSYTSKFYTNPTAGTFSINSVKFTLSDVDADSKIDKIDVADAGGTSLYTASNATGVTLNDIITAINNDTVKGATGATVAYSAITDKLSVTTVNPGGALNLGSGGDTSNFLNSVGLNTAQRVGDTKTSVSHLGRIRTTQLLSSANFATAVTADAEGNGKFAINGVEITYNKNTDTLQNVIDRINASTAGVTTTYDSLQDKLILTNKSTGSTAISRSDITGNFLAAADLLGSATETLGNNARLTISGVNNGEEMASASNEVSGIVAGITFSLKKNGEADIVVSQDATKAKDAIKDFVNKYNATIALINTKLSEEKVKNPKTLDDKKKGLLRADNVLIDLKSKIISKSTTTVSGLPATLDHLSEIGITLTSDDFGKSSALVLDETKLDEKLSENINAVVNLFFNDKDGDGKVDVGEDGIAARVSSYMDQIIDTGGTKTVTSHEQDSTGTNYIGAWAPAFGGSVTQSSTAGDAAEFAFTGSSLTWYATKHNNQGIAKVYIDGAYKTDIDLYSNSQQDRQAVYTADGLTNGPHTVRIEVTNTKNASSSGYNVNVDSFDVTYTNSTGVIPRQQDVLKSQMDYIGETIEAMDLRLAKRQETLTKKFIAMEQSLSRLQQISARFQQQLSNM